MTCAIPPRPSPSLLRSPLNELPSTPPLLTPRSPFGLHAFSFAPLPPSSRSPCTTTDAIFCPSRKSPSIDPSTPLRTIPPANLNGSLPAPLIPTPAIAKESPFPKFSDQSAALAERSRSVLGSIESNLVGTPETGVSKFFKECCERTAGSRGKEDHSSLDRSFKSRRDEDPLSSPEISLSLKRKRPPKLFIPESASLVALGRSLLSEEVGQDTYSVENSMFGVFCKKGRRAFMEDTHRAITNFQGNPNQAFFGVFDGHGGRKAAEFVAQELPERIVDAIDQTETGKEDFEQAVRTSYLKTDAVFLDKRVESGACSVSAFVKDGQMVVANTGDCRAVLSRNGNAEALTRDHRAGREDERKRIESLGGYVDCFNGVWRVQGTLCVTRSFGDMHLKRWISAEPDVKKLELTPDCEFLILASDGLWDKVSDQEAVDCARASLGLGTASDWNPCKAQKLYHDSYATVGRIHDAEQDRSLVSACQKLVEMAADRCSLDDITVVIVSVQKLFCEAKK